MAGSDGLPGGPVRRTRHVVPAIVLLGMAAFATWNVVHNSDWQTAVLPFGSGFRPDVFVAGGLAVTWWAGGLGMLTLTAAGSWLGRLGAAALVAIGGYVVWDQVAHPSGSTLYGDPLLIAVPLAALLVGTGIGILLALRPGSHADGRRGGSPPSG